MATVALIKDPLFQGMTRPTMLLGVTYEAFVFNFLFSTIVFLGSGNLLSGLVAVPIHLVCFLICLREPRFFGLVKLWLLTSGRTRNRFAWSAASSSPLAYRRNSAIARYLVDAARPVAR